MHVTNFMIFQVFFKFLLQISNHCSYDAAALQIANGSLLKAEDMDKNQKRMLT